MPEFTSLLPLLSDLSDQATPEGMHNAGEGGRQGNWKRKPACVHHVSEATSVTRVQFWAFQHKETRSH